MIDHYYALYGRKPAFIEVFAQLDYVDTKRHKLALVNILNPVDSGYINSVERLFFFFFFIVMFTSQYTNWHVDGCRNRPEEK